MDKTITLEEGIYKDLKVIAAASGTNSKNYIEKLVTEHVGKRKLVISHPERKKK